MALSIDKGHTALLAMDFENDIVHENGAFKDFGFAAMAKQNDVLAKSARLLDAARGSGVKVIYVVIKYRPGYPERPGNSGLFAGTIQANAIVDGTWGFTLRKAGAGGPIRRGLKPNSLIKLTTKKTGLAQSFSIEPALFEILSAGLTLATGP